MVTHLTVEQRQLALRLKARGLSLREIGREVGCLHESGVMSLTSSFGSLAV